MVFKYVIVGAGFAGLTLARALVKQGASPARIALIDDYRSSRGSNPPRALVHPFVGRSLKPSPYLVSAWEQVRELLTDPTLPSQLATPITLLRPFNETQGNRLANSFAKYGPQLQKDFQLSLISSINTRKNYSFLNNAEGAIAINSAYQIDLASLCDTLHKNLDAAGVTFINDSVIKLLPHETTQLVTKQNEFQADTLILAVGSQLNDFFPDLPLAPTHGHLVQIDWANGIPTNLGISMGGHLIHQHGNKWVLGTTYFPPTKQIPSKQELFEQMHQNMCRWVPALRTATLDKIWSGVRCVLEPLRQPVAGPIAGMKNLFVLSGFGSKGGLWTPLLAQQLAGLLVQNDTNIQLIAPPTQYPNAWKLNPNIQ